MLSSSSNFDFLENINPDVCKSLKEAEKKARTNFVASGLATRKALEQFINSVITSNHLEGHFRNTSDLFKRLEMLRNEQEMQDAGYLKAGQTFKDKPLLPDMETVRFKYENGDEGNGDYYHFLRKYGNSAHHAEDSDYKRILICNDSVVKSLKGYYLLMRRYYKDRVPNELPAFNEDTMPIEDYQIIKAYVPNDSARSKCIKEFFAYLPENQEYAILRMYNREESNKTFMLRNHDCFIAASQQSPSVPEGMAKFRGLIPKNSRQSSFYITAYIFNKEPHPLTNTILKEMELAQRLRLCSRLVKYLDNLHNFDEMPIYHRMLNFESIFICKIGKEWYPYIIKFDYAKIVAGEVGTVYADTIKAGRIIKETRLTKYLAPEWQSITDETPQVDWAKVDVYSLGVLLSDILYGRIGDTQVELDELEECGVSELVIGTLEMMLAEKPEKRLSMREVKEFFEEETR